MVSADRTAAAAVDEIDARLSGVTAELADVGRPIAAQWRSDLEFQQERGASNGWVAYRAGGVDVLEELLG